MSAMSKNIVP